jgi:hypothetical protein
MPQIPSYDMLFWSMRRNTGGLDRGCTGSITDISPACTGFPAYGCTAVRRGSADTY